MSAPCPLAVMDAIAHSVEQALVPGNDYRRELRAVQQALPEARAAVAELVNASRAGLKLLERWAVKIDVEWGSCRELEEIEADGELETEIIALRAALAAVGTQQPAAPSGVVLAQYSTQQHGQVVYQIENDPEEWFDVDRAMYEGHDGSRKRILYSAAPPPPAAAEMRSPSYDALLLIAQSVCGALERGGVTDCDDPGEAIDVLREQYEAKIAALAQQSAAVAELVEAANAIAPYIVTEVLEHCDGNKCREPWCRGCMGESADEAVQQSNAGYRRLRAALAKFGGAA